MQNNAHWVLEVLGLTRIFVKQVSCDEPELTNEPEFLNEPKLVKELEFF